MSPIRQLLLKNQIKILMKNHHQKKKTEEKEDNSNDVTNKSSVNEKNG